MQDKDSEVLNHQRKRRKRIARIRNGIILIVAGWIALSMILIVTLFFKMVSLEHKIDRLVTSSSEQNTDQINAGAAAKLNSGVIAEETEETEETEVIQTEMTWDKVTPPATGIPDEDNMASESDLHKVYLTFDNVPSEHTSEILDVLEEYNVKATFFVNGNQDEEMLSVYQRIVDEGHTLGMNSYSNQYSVIYQSEDAFEQDYMTLKNFLKQTTGVDSLYYRFPGGSSNLISNVPMDYFIHYLNTQGIIYYDWNVSAGDGASTAYTSEEIVENVTDDVVKYKTSVVLLHDGTDKSATVEALGPLIEALEGMGAQILPIDEDTQVIQYVKADTVE